MSKETNGYNGADIESVIKESIENAFIEERKEIKTDDIRSVIKDTKSITDILGEKKMKEIEEKKEEMKIKYASKK